MIIKDEWVVLFQKMGCNECMAEWWDYNKSTCTCDEVTE